MIRDSCGFTKLLMGIPLFLLGVLAGCVKDCDHSPKWDGVEENMAVKGPQGRRPTIPAALLNQVFAWHGSGYGMRRIAGLLGERGIAASKSSVFRLIHGMEPYGR